MKPIGKRTQRWAAWRRKNYGLLALRCRGVCEGCGGRTPLDPHHVIGRESEPFSSHVSLLAGLCRSCHRAVTGEPGSGIELTLNAMLMERAEARFRDVFGFWLGAFPSEFTGRLGLYEYDLASNSIVRKDT